jgi:hypothetical protein
MAIPAEAANAFFDLAPIMTVRKMKVRMISAAKAATRPYPPGD